MLKQFINKDVRNGNFREVEFVDEYGINHTLTRVYDIMTMLIDGKSILIESEAV